VNWSACGAAYLKCNDRAPASGAQDTSQALGRDLGNNLEYAP